MVEQYEVAQKLNSQLRTDVKSWGQIGFYFDGHRSQRQLHDILSRMLLAVEGQEVVYVTGEARQGDDGYSLDIAIYTEQRILTVNKALDSAATIRVRSRSDLRALTIDSAPITTTDDLMISGPSKLALTAEYEWGTLKLPVDVGYSRDEPLAQLLPSLFEDLERNGQSDFPRIGTDRHDRS